MCALINYVAPVTLVQHPMDDCLAVILSVPVSFLELPSRTAFAMTNNGNSTLAYLLALPILYAAAGVLAPNSARFLHRSGIGFAHPLRCRWRPCTIIPPAFAS